MIRRAEGVSGINDLIHWSEGDLATCFLLFMCGVKAASSILATLTSLQQQLHITTIHLQAILLGKGNIKTT